MKSGTAVQHMLLVNKIVLTGALQRECVLGRSERLEKRRDPTGHLSGLSDRGAGPVDFGFRPDGAGSLDGERCCEISKC